VTIPGQAITALAIIELAAAEHGVEAEMLRQERRDKPTVAARHAAMRRIRRQLGWSYPRIGRLFNCDHIIVMHACEKTT
jgi:chromosomal replication initiation ATPase DnaA